jgi:putative DNA methylase
VYDGYPRKLIEVALPLREISKASVADKNRKVGTIKNLHKWFAPMPTPALRALIFATLVNDPGSDAEREKLTEILKELVPERGTAPDGDVLERARNLIARDNPELPIVLDPFCGGGSTVVEAQRLGLPAVASDLNPVAVLITRVLGGLLPPMAHAPSVSAGLGKGPAAQPMFPADSPFAGFIADLRYYGSLVQRSVQDRLGDLYPKIPQGDPVAWLWCRTVPCHSHLCGTTVPLLSSAVLSRQPGREATVEAIIEAKSVRFVVRTGRNGPIRAVKVQGGRARFECLACGASLGEKELRRAGQNRSMGLQLMAVCVDLVGGSGRAFLSPDEVPAPACLPAVPSDLDEIEVGKNTRDFRSRLYGLERHIDLYTPRQLTVLAAFADAVADVADRVREDGGDAPQVTGIASVLGLCIGKMAQANSMLVRWRIDSRNGAAKAEPAFATQAIPMLWDFAEAYPFGASVGSWQGQITSVSGALGALPVAASPAHVVQRDARKADDLVSANAALLATDPPYFAQINYADLADYFYLWLRRAMRKEHPDLFKMLATPKAEELTANPDRFGGSRTKAREYFITGFTEVFSSLKAASRPDLPLVVAYAHKQDEHLVDGVSSTGWAALLEAMLAADIGIVRTWPIEATSTTRQVGQGTNALASYVIMICRPRPADLPSTDRRGFLNALAERLPGAIRELGHISAVDLAQAAIGPGMAVFSSFSKVLEHDGRRMSVPTALALINEKLQGILWDQEGEFDRETRAAVAWYDEFGWTTGDSKRAEQIAFGKNSTIPRLVQAHIWWSKGGNTRLVTVDELPEPGSRNLEPHLTVWELAMLLSRQLHRHGVPRAAQLMADTRSYVRIDAVKDLAILLYAIAEKRKRSDDQLRFNALVTAWPDLIEAVRRVPADGRLEQPTLDEMG